MTRAVTYWHEVAICCLWIEVRLLRTDFDEVLFAAVQLIPSSDTSSEAVLMLVPSIDSESLPPRFCVSRAAIKSERTLQQMIRPALCWLHVTAHHHLDHDRLSFASP